MNKKILIFLLLFIAPLKAEQFYSIEKFTFELPEGYIILNNDNIYNILDSSNSAITNADTSFTLKTFAFVCPCSKFLGK